MSAHPIYLSALSLLAASPLQTGVTLPLEPMNRVQIEATGRAGALIESMPRGVARHQAATFLAYRLMMRGDCPQALVILNRELIGVADPTAVGGLITGALVGRDPRCMAWVAARVDAVIQSRTLPEEQRSELHMRGQTLFELVGQMTRAAEMPSTDDAMLDIVPEAVRHRDVELGDTTLHVTLSDAPTRREALLVDRLWDFRGTPLQLRLARALANRAASEPGFLSPSGWVEVALVLLAEGQSQAAQQVLVDARVRFMTLAGLEAETALRHGDYERAAGIFAANEWGTKSKSVYVIFRNRPEVLIPFGESVVGRSSTAGLDLMALSRALDRAGHPDEAYRAAVAALARFNTNGTEEITRAQALARTGDLGGARRLLAQAMEQPARNDPDSFRMAIVQGAALAGNLAEVERELAEAPAGLRDLMLLNSLVTVAAIPSPMRAALEARLASRIAEGSHLNPSMDAMVAFAQAGIETPLLVSVLERLDRGRPSSAAGILVANVSLRNGHREAATEIAQVTERLLPQGPSADAELVQLAEFYWRLGTPEPAISVAMRVSHPIGRIDAIARAIVPTRGETREKLSFETF